MSFNEHFYQVNSPEQSILQAVAYVVRKDGYGNAREHDILAKEVANYMIESEWTKHFGLSYSETMALPYSEWQILQKAIYQKKTHTNIP